VPSGSRSRVASRSSFGEPGGAPACGVIDLLRASSWLYPLVQVVHIVGFIVLAGAAILFDLRLLGLTSTRGQSPVGIRALGLHLLPWSMVAALMVVPSGVLMFVVDAPALVGNTAFVTKMALLGLVACNAAAFHLGPGRAWAAWEQPERSGHHGQPGEGVAGATAVPPGAKLHAAASLFLWISIVGCGRLIAYV